MASVKQFTIFHFSPRYVGQENLLREEAHEAYKQILEDDMTCNLNDFII